MKKIILLDFMVRDVIKPFLSVLLATGVVILSGSNLVAQKKQTFNELVTVEAVNLPIELIITQLSENNEINFSYNSNLFNKNLLKTINVQDKPLSKVLSQLFTDTPYLFQEKNGVIIIYELAKPAIQKVFELSGYVIDSITNKPIPDVNIFISYTSQGTSTDENGYYALKVNMSGIQELVFSHVGYSPLIKRLDFRRTEINMERTLLQPKLKMLNEIVIDASKQQIGDEEL